MTPKHRKYPFKLRLASFLLPLLGYLGCGGAFGPGQSISSSATDCVDGSAQIEMGDGYMRILCGCTGAGQGVGTLFTSGSTLTCNLQNSDSLVFFRFLSTQLKHQVRFESSPHSIPFPLSDPTAANPLRVFAVRLPQASLTYTFQDAFTPGLTGQIVVP